MALNQALHTLTKRYGFALFACCAGLATVISACSSSSETSDMTNEDNAQSELLDPSGIMANLEFRSAEDDADYQCLITAATASASARGLNAFPVVFEGQPIGRGVYAT